MSEQVPSKDRVEVDDRRIITEPARIKAFDPEDGLWLVQYDDERSEWVSRDQIGPKVGTTPEPSEGCSLCSNVAPIAKLTVRDGLVQRAGLYAPGLPDGDHDVYPSASSPPPADEALSLLKCVYREVSDFAGVSEETMQAIELHLQSALTKRTGRCPHGYELANLDDGTDTCKGCSPEGESDGG